jgi:predicted ribosomally synthesized peptide with SipW-like signal peptide
MSLVIVSLVASLVTGGVMAYFSDTETSLDNTFTAGSIDITLSGDVSSAVHGSAISDFKPCEVGYLLFTITNVGQNPVDVWKHLMNVVCTENGVVTPEGLWYTANSIADPPGKNDIDTVILFDLYIDVNGNGEIDVDDICLIPESEGLHIDDVECFYIYLGVLDPSESIDIIQSFHMEADTEDWAQSDIMTFDEEFVGQQITDPDPPGTELLNHGKP